MEQDGFYIGSKEQCEAYNAVASRLENYREGTSQWATVTKHPEEEKWSITGHKKYKHPLMEWVEKLNDTWYPKEI